MIKCNDVKDLRAMLDKLHYIATNEKFNDCYTKHTHHNNGSIVNVFDNGTITFQGTIKEEEKNKLIEIIEAINTLKLK
ncbi:hypothetical protein [Helicobacter cetorum]|uniref:Uncharacterized protein n=1 Tax=Helicobacter cetorum (strain ATCC BAA-429 / MIT 00-7128) TaxID=182217 RepID=I0ELW0_HELC0|nr:hypothetical protein [Helicobacter cetorum]AFI03929.1 hypothetical protein HCW_03240 [Helicobacter cetorum MIT 00-7128]